MLILGIESSCDETAASLVENKTKVLSNVVSSSIKIHIKTGGIIPENAAREQIKAIIPVIKKSLETENKTYIPNDIDALGVTVGPGLIGSLLVGVETAKSLSYLWKKPLIPVNHLSAHIYANFLDKDNPILFPAVCLIVSGGHTDLIYIKNHSDYEWIGGTRDDASGEAFDKCARLLGLPYPGGPSISKAAENFLKDINKHKSFLPRPMINEDNFDFSFSGLKTAVLREFKKDSDVGLFAFEIQEAIAEVLVEKTLRAVKKYNPKNLLLAGGVASNNRLRELFNQKIEDEKINVIFSCPEPKYCTDNAAVVASCASYNYFPKNISKIEANPQLTILDRL